MQQSGKPAPGTPHYDGPLDVVKKLYKEGGIRSIYRGTAATLLRGERLHERFSFALPCI